MMTKILSDSKVSSMVIGNYSIPDGAKATPVDDYTIWLRCATLPNTYGSLANVIADTTAMETLCNNLNALRYMVRGEDVIMPAVLDDADWVAELDGCAYSIQVPTMTSPTTPSGIVSQSDVKSVDYPGWLVFDKQYSSVIYMWLIPVGQHTGWVQYNFGKNVRVYRGAMIGAPSTNQMWKTVQMQSSSDGTTFDNATDVINVIQSTSAPTEFIITNNIQSAIWRLNCLSDYNYGASTGLGELYLYGLDLS